jgi:hypothetical protein
MPDREKQVPKTCNTSVMDGGVAAARADLPRTG